MSSAFWLGKLNYTFSFCFDKYLLLNSGRQLKFLIIIKVLKMKHNFIHSFSYTVLVQLCFFFEGGRGYQIFAISFFLSSSNVNYCHVHAFLLAHFFRADFYRQLLVPHIMNDKYKECDVSSIHSTLPLENSSKKYDVALEIKSLLLY